MPLQDQVIPINFGQGIDTKTDPKLVVAGKMLRLENAVFTNAKRITKRNGYTSLSRSIVGGGTLAGPNLCKAFNNEFVCADSGRFYSYSTTLSAWMDRGKYQSIGVFDTAVTIPDGSTPFNNFSNGASLGNYALFCWDSNGIPTVTLMDLPTNTYLLSNHALAGLASGGVSSPKVVALGSTALAVFYLSSTQTLVARILSVSAGSGATFTPEIVIANDVVKQGVPGGYDAIQYDVVSTATGAVVTYSSAATFTGTPVDVKTKTLSTAGAVTHTATISAAGSGLPIAVSTSSNGDVWVYWGDTGGGFSNLYYAVYDSILSVVLGKTLITSDNAMRQLSVVQKTATTQRVYYSTTRGTVVPYIFYADVTTTTVVGTTFALQGVDLYSKAVVYGSKTYLGAVFTSTTQSTVFFFDIADNVVVAKCFFGRSEGVRPTSALTAPFTITSTQIGVAAGVTSIAGKAPGGGSAELVYSTDFATLDFNHADAFQAVKEGQNLVLNGGIVSSYDGQSTTELGFHVYPEPLSLTEHLTGGSLSAGTYQYICIYEWQDAQGNVHQSAPSVAKSITVSASSYVIVKAMSLGITQKTSPLPEVRLLLYRTKVNGTTFFALTNSGGTSQILNTPATDLITYNDGSADSDISGDEFPYTTGGIIENIAPPPSLIMTAKNNRVWLVDSTNRNNIWYSKTYSPGNGLAFSDLITLQMEELGGPISALQGMDDKLVIFKTGVPFYVSGDGVNDAGTGSTLSTPQAIPADTGCIASKSCILMPNGVFFKSPKGIYIVDRSLSVQYLGLDVEAYNSQDITAATLVYNKNQVRFLTSSGLALVYDYVFNQWATFTNHQGYAADLFQNQYTYIRTDGLIFQESTTSYLDNSTAFKLLAQTAWLALSGVQGFERVRKFESLGDFTNGLSASHGVQVSAAYDFVSSFSTPIVYTFGSASASGPFQYRESIPRQKCDAISLLIEEVTTGDSAESIDLSDMSFEAGMKKGSNKLATSKMLG